MLRVTYGPFSEFIDYAAHIMLVVEIKQRAHTYVSESEELLYHNDADTCIFLVAFCNDYA